MPRRSREDLPGSWHHVVNRAIARRPLFEDRDDIRYFLSRMALEVRRGRLELHAWSLLTTHFHLLVRSLTGELSEALRCVQADSSRHFNRPHRRDGPLVRGRFLSKPVRSFTYRWNLVRYIDANAVQAGLVARAADYRFGSAAHYARPIGPPWCARWWIEEVVRARTKQLVDCGGDDAERIAEPDSIRRLYETAFPPLRPGSVQRWVERRVARGFGSDPLDRLVGSAPPRVRRWMASKARLADGGPVGLALCDAESIHRAIQDEPWSVQIGSSARRAVQVNLLMAMEVGLLRDLAALSWSEIAKSCRTSSSTVGGRYRMHARLMECEAEYGERVGRVACRVLAELHGDRVVLWGRHGEYGVAADSSVSRRREREERSNWRLTEQSATTPYSRRPGSPTLGDSAQRRSGS
jgi:REP element-mobilizing transposase RayT